MTYRIRWTIEQQAEFVRRMLKFREKNGLSQEQLAIAMGVTSRTISRTECGTFVPSNMTVLKFGEVEKRYREAEKRERDPQWRLDEANAS